MVWTDGDIKNHMCDLHGQEDETQIQKHKVKYPKTEEWSTGIKR